MIKKTLQDKIRGRLFKGKAILLFEPRQCGKSTLVNMLLRDLGRYYLYLNGDEADVREMLTHTTSAKLKALAGKNPVVFIDEAQRIPDIG